MASNFRIFSHKNSDNLHLKLFGDFDGSSAHELVNILKKYDGSVERIFIHTCDLSAIDPLGLDAFKKNCNINNLFDNLTFTGEHRNIMSPLKNNFL